MNKAFLPAALLPAGLGLAALALGWLLLAPALSHEPLPGYDPLRMVLHYATLPRLAAALICGAALALSGAIFQHVLRNPLASPGTLGVSTGANLALVAATLAAPSLLGTGSGLGRDLVAVLGSLATAGLVLGLGAKRGFVPLTLVLAGMVVSLWCGAVAALLGFLNERYVSGLFIWGAGSLAQQGWDIPLALLWKTAGLAGLTLLLLRPLSLLDLGEENARARGLNLAWLRLSALVIAVLLAALVTSAVGVFGFVGLIAPVLARLAGARRLPAFLAIATLTGAFLLLLADIAIQLAAGVYSDFLPTGAVTAVLGSPLLLLLLPRLRERHRVIAQASLPPPAGLRPGAVLALNLALLLAVALLALTAGRGSDGIWALAFPSPEILELRAPRLVVALASGAMLAVAGLILQRLTGNELASPEVTGVSAGATFGLAISLFLAGSTGLGAQLGFAAAGSFAVLGLIALLTRKGARAPGRILLVGIALGALIDALLGVLMASGDPRALQLMRWLAGSTYSATPGMAALVAGAALLLIAAALLARRWLTLLPLGPQITGALGLPPRLVQLCLLLIAGSLTALATLGIGPISFVGLMAAHLAAMQGLRRAPVQLLGAALAGATIMTGADWIGRMAFFPYQVPAGLMAALLGAPFLLLVLFRSGRKEAPR